MKVQSAHADCWTGEPCKLGQPTECPPHVVISARDRGRPWSQLEVSHETGGLRHYLDGEPVHCGCALELQAQAVGADDYGEYTRWLPEGRAVRYEARTHGGVICSTLHATVAGHEFIATLEPWMRFRRRS